MQWVLAWRTRWGASKQAVETVTETHGEVRAGGFPWNSWLRLLLLEGWEKMRLSKAL